MRVPRKEKNLFHREESRSNPYRLLLWAALIVASAYLLRGIDQGEVEPLFLPTPTATRTADSFRLEGEAHFSAGDLAAAIEAYQGALEDDPDNPQVLAELAHIQTYYSDLRTFGEKRELLAQALENINRAVELAPSDSNVFAIQALVLDWNAGVASILGDQEAVEDYLARAGQAAIRARQLNNQNALALAFLAEVQVDQFQWTQARQNAELAVKLEPNLMDTHRVFAYVLESTGFYSQAIEEYQKAAEIAPNMTFLYIKIGQNYRQLQLYDQALDYFDRAATINEALGIEDPLPFIAIAKTYARQGEFFIAARNVQAAIELDPANADYYGQLGVIFFRSRNYEGSIPVLRCAVRGCSAAEVTVVLDDLSIFLDEEQEVSVPALPLDGASVVYYYTFGSVLAALNQCEEAVPVLDEIEAEFSQDSLVMGIVQESQFICEQFASGSE